MLVQLLILLEVVDLIILDTLKELIGQVLVKLCVYLVVLSLPVLHRHLDVTLVGKLILDQTLDVVGVKHFLMGEFCRVRSLAFYIF